MAYDDVSADIASVSQHYANSKFLPWILHLQELLQQIWQSLLELLNALLRLKGAGASDSRSLSLLIQYGLYAAGIIALVLIAYLLWRRIATSRKIVFSTSRGAASVEKILDSKGYRSEGERLAGTNDFKGACRALYLCLLQHLHEEKVATFAPAKTNYEYRYLLLSFPQLQSDFIQIADKVEQIWFGNKQALAADYAECLRLLGLAVSEIEHISAAKAKLKLEPES